MKHWINALGIGILCLWMAGCRPASPSEPALRKIAMEYLQAHDSDAAKWDKLPGRVIDHGDQWEYVFDPPEFQTGGDLMVYINKGTLQVSEVLHGQ